MPGRKSGEGIGASQSSNLGAPSLSAGERACVLLVVACLAHFAVSKDLTSLQGIVDRFLARQGGAQFLPYGGTDALELGDAGELHALVRGLRQSSVVHVHSFDRLQLHRTEPRHFLELWIGVGGLAVAGWNGDPT